MYSFYTRQSQMSRQESKRKEVVTVTKKGQATIPKSMRERHRIGRKVLAVDTRQGVMFVPLPDPSMERGSLKETLGNRSSKEIMGEIRKQEESKVLEKSKKMIGLGKKKEQ